MSLTPEQQDQIGELLGSLLFKIISLSSLNGIIREDFSGESRKAKDIFDSLVNNFCSNNRQDGWRELITDYKEFFRNFFVGSLPRSAQLEWTDVVLSLVDSVANLTFSIINEDVFYGLTELKKVNKLSESCFDSLISFNLKKLISWTPKVANYHQTETTLREKLKSLNLIEKELRKTIGQDEKNRKAREELQSKFNQTFDSITSEEMIIFKKKFKRAVIKIFTSSGNYIKNIPSLNDREKKILEKLSEKVKMVKTFLDVLDSIIDGQTSKKLFKLIKVLERKKIPLGNFSRAVTEAGPEVKEFITSLTSHLKELTNKMSQNRGLSQRESKEILKNLKTKTENPNPPPKSEDSWGKIIPVAQKLFSENESDKGSIFSEVLWNELTTLRGSQNKEWYKDPLTIGLGITLIATIIGLGTWLFLRKRNTQKNYTKK